MCESCRIHDVKNLKRACSGAAKRPVGKTPGASSNALSRVRLMTMVSIPKIPSDILDPLSHKAMPLPWTSSLPSHDSDPGAPQTPKVRRFITLSKRLSASLPSQVPTNNQAPESSPESRFKIDFPLSFFGTFVLRVMTGLRWRATTATPLPDQDEDIPAGLSPQRTDAISIETQPTRAPGQLLRRASACLPQRTDAISIETQPTRAPGQLLRRASTCLPQRTDAISIETQPTRAPGQVLRRASTCLPRRTDAISIETQMASAPGQVLRRAAACLLRRTDAIKTQTARAPGQVLRRTTDCQVLRRTTDCRIPNAL